MGNKNQNYRLYITGGLLGAIVGVLAALLIEKSSEFEDGDIHISRGKLSKLGFGAISMLWSLLDQGKGKKHL